MNNSRQTAEIAHIEVMPDHVIVTDVKIFGLPAQKIYEGVLDGTEPIDTFNKMLEIGAIALHSLDKKGLHKNLEEGMDNFVKQINKCAFETFPQILEERAKLTINKLLDESILKYLDPTKAESLSSQIVNNTEKIQAILTENLMSLGVIKNVKNKSSSKGISHQDYVGEKLEEFAGSVDNISDVSAGVTGKSYAVGKSNSGDYLVTLGETASTSNRICFSVEAKNTKLSEKSALNEISDNCKNRGVDVGILVFASQDQAPTNGKPLKIMGNKIFVVCDNGSETALQAAYTFARTMSKNLKTSVEFDQKSLAAAIERIVNILDIEEKVNKFAKYARHNIDNLASTALGTRAEVLDILSQFDSKNDF